MISRRYSALAAALLLTLTAADRVTRAQAGGPVNLTALGAAYTQDFATLASSGTSSVLPAGWAFSESGTNANATYAERNRQRQRRRHLQLWTGVELRPGLWRLAEWLLIPTVGAAFTNDTGQTITQPDDCVHR